MTARLLSLFATEVLPANLFFSPCIPGLKALAHNTQRRRPTYDD